MASFKLLFDVLGFVQEDGSRGEVEGKGNVFDDLPAEAVARGLETGALEPVVPKAPAKPKAKRRTLPKPKAPAAAAPEPAAEPAAEPAEETSE